MKLSRPGFNGGGGRNINLQSPEMKNSDGDDRTSRDGNEKLKRMMRMHWIVKGQDRTVNPSPI